MKCLQNKNLGYLPVKCCCFLLNIAAFAKTNIWFINIQHNNYSILTMFEEQLILYYKNISLKKLTIAAILTAASRPGSVK